MAPMSVPRRALGVAVMRGRIYAVGGGNGDDDELASGEVYDPRTDTWTPIAPMRTARYGLVLAALNDKLYAFGGVNQSSIEAYDPEADEWAVVGEMPEQRWAMSVVTYDGAVYVVGGQTSAASLANDVLRYTPERAEWRRLRPLLPGGDGGRTYGAGVAVHGRSLYVVGGLKEGDALINIIRHYNLETVS
ncbi:Influenza virus NS1A-binding protein homolog [Eumeta japonica]|uniref:Influenza virus NS1A-binding protein homolog n=1 Tax=Eumeta variegata TaxID=151549 RepID=A0A4C1SZE7_EUMVA|nr:Influenza virus NS1A-binding protein homolog [Eumeta japonica]